MKRVITLIVAALMIATMVSSIVPSQAKTAVPYGRNATFIANRWAPIGFTWSANRLYADRTRNFEIGGTYTGWGREGYRMPACTDNPLTGAVREPDVEGPLYNVPAVDGTAVEPRFWTEFYLTVIPDGGQSTETDHWFAVVDSGGNVWFDPDGFFHDCRYYAFGDPRDHLYNFDDLSLFDHCTRNPKAFVDPTSANNTQGPYPLLPTTENGQPNPGYIDTFHSRPFDVFSANALPDGERLTGLGSTPMYFMEPKLKRIFRIGWVDMIDFPLAFGGSDDNHPENPALDNRAARETVVGNSHRADVFANRASYFNIGANAFWNHRYDDWDYDMQLARFRDGANGDVGVDGPFWQNFYDNIWHSGEEWHVENLSDRTVDFNNYISPAYDPGEWIYRGGTNRQIYNPDPFTPPYYGRNFVIGYDPFMAQWSNDGIEMMGGGDMRLTPVSVYVMSGIYNSTLIHYSGGITYNYAPGTEPKDRGQWSGWGGQFGVWDAGDDFDIGMMDTRSALGDPDPDSNPRLAVRFRLSESNFGQVDPGLTPTQYDELHSENISSRLLGTNPINGLPTGPIYDPYEFVFVKGYQDGSAGRIPNTGNRVQFGDWRYSNVNTNAHPWATHTQDITTESTPAFQGNEPNRLGGLWIGDVLILSEVLTTVSNDDDVYNLSVETDLWEGMIPSQTTAVIRSQVGEIQDRGLTIQKSTVLGPTPTSFAVPACTFMDCYPRSRQYLGVEIFFDNGIDMNMGVQHYTNVAGDPPDTDRLVFNNLSDDYRPGRTGEQFLGAQDPNKGLYSHAWFTSQNASFDTRYMRALTGTDVGRRLTSFTECNPPVRFLPTRNPGGPGGGGEEGFNLYGCGMAIYLDADGNYEISRGDRRLSRITINRSGAIITLEPNTIVNNGDPDTNAWPFATGDDLSDFTVGLANDGTYHYPMFYDEFMPDADNPLLISPPNGTYDYGEIIYDTDTPFNGFFMNDRTTYVAPRFQRLTGGWVGNTYYECGSIVPEYDFWFYPSVPYSVTSGLNGDPRFMDWEVVPGDIKLEVTVDKPLMVEQTSDIKVTVNPPPRPGHWIDMGDRQAWIPDEKVYVLVRDSAGGIAADMSDTNVNAQYRVLTPSSPETIFTMTPYRGSCHPRAFEMTEMQRDAMKVRIQAFKEVPQINITPNRTTKADIMVVPPDQHNGFQLPDDPNTVWDESKVRRPYTLHMYRDLFWSEDWVQLINWKNPTYGGRHWKNRQPMYGKKVPGLSMLNMDNHGVDLLPSPPVPMAMMDSYDSYGEKLVEVAPEQMKVEANVACITTVDQRFPNIQLSLYNWDNPDDVNDPYAVSLAVKKVAGTRFHYDPFDPNQSDPVNVATYNAHGGGVDWLGWAQAANPINGEKYIFQANIDGTYEYWYWYEPDNTNPALGPQIENAIDPNDYIIGQQWQTFPILCLDEVKRTGVYVDQRSHWEDADCSSNQDVDCGADLHMPAGFKKFSDVTGELDNPMGSDHYGLFDGTLGWIIGYGVPTYVTPYGELTSGDPGGQCLITVHPKDGSTHLNIYVYTQRAVFDYNSTQAHPITGSNFFISDIASGNPPTNPTYINLGKNIDGVDYAGFLDMKVYPPDPYVNFAEWLIVDKGLQYSQVNYTAATTDPLTGKFIPGTSEMPPPAPQIIYPYWPILRTSHGGFRCYPGGQTHTGRVLGQNFNSNGGAFGWNSYPAIWSEEIQRNLEAEKFFKLGTEFFPLTDYGIYFILKDGEGKHLSFNSAEIDRQIKRIEISGPFARPKINNVTKNTVATGYVYNGLTNVPVQYDYSGKLVIDETNWSFFEFSPGIDYLGVSTYGDVDYGTYRNRLLERTRKLDYCSLNNVFVLDEIIPWNYGKINIYVTLADGTFKMYQDCCTAPPVDGIDVRALDLKQWDGEGYEPVDKITLGADNKLSLSLQEHEWATFNKEWAKDISQYCNDAYIYVWQDRGVRDPRDQTGYLKLGAGDGWVTNPPFSSRADGATHMQFRTDQDLNSDSKIRFNDWESEICGTYDMAANTWIAGAIDARTFQRNNGRYDFDLTEGNGARIDTIGLDFGGEEGVGDPPDHIISDKEVLPLYITAYKYGDDNNDRSFGPFWDNDPYYSQYNTLRQYDRTRFSHEVYLSAQMAISIEPADDLVVTYTPNPLTAGITPELVDVNSPLTLQVKRSTGEAVNLCKGIVDGLGFDEVEEKNIWNMLFKDPHPDDIYYYGRMASLPQYYWLRTDLHNDDGSQVNNRELYSTRVRDQVYQCKETILEAFEPIIFNADCTAGLYYFRGFCANDNNEWIKDPEHPDREMWEKQHLFRVYVYTPDRRSRGYVDIKVVNPHVEYSIVNIEDPQLRAFEVPGEPDFIMTAADNRIYRVTATVSNAQGQLVKGVTKGVSVCGGGVKNTARFTPFTTRPQSFDFLNEACDHVPCCEVTYPHFGFDFTGDGNITWEDQELYQAGGFTLKGMNNKCWDRQAVGPVYYNTMNTWYRDDNTWDVVNEATSGQRVEVVNLLLPPPPWGWGLGAIYNWPYWGGLLFNDINRDGELSYYDALGLDVNAQTTFYLWAEDLLYVGGLVGDNIYVNKKTTADLVGYPSYTDKTNPRYIIKRFRGGVSNDSVFYLDWEAIPDKVAQVSYPKVELFYAFDESEVSKNLLNVDNYDMVYNIDNHFIARLFPAFKDDLPLKEDGRLYVSGNQHQESIYGNTKKSVKIDGATETTFHYMPTGTGQSTVYLSYLAKNAYFHKTPYLFDGPEWYCLKKFNHIDVGKGLEIKIMSEGLAPNTPTDITVYVNEIGTGTPVPEATVYIEGPGITQTPLTTNANGEVKIAKVSPKSGGKIVITAEKEDYIAGTAWVAIGKDTMPPMLDVDPLPPITNKTSINVTGKTEAGVKVTVNGVAARVDDSGKFTAQLALKEGTNAVVVEAMDPTGNKTTKIVSIDADFSIPTYYVDGDKNGIVMIKKDATTVKLTGRVEPYSQVFANGVPAKCPYDIWEVEVTFNADLLEMDVTLQFIDKAGNKAEYKIKLQREQ